MKKSIKLGQRVRFHYPNFGTPEAHPEYRRHSGTFVTVLREENVDNLDAGERAFTVRATDGSELFAWESELGTATFTPHDPKFCGCRVRR